MITVELYEILLSHMDLSNITYWEDVILCSGVGLCYILEFLVWFFIISLLTKIITKRTIFYWFNKFM